MRGRLVRLTLAASAVAGLGCALLAPPSAAEERRSNTTTTAYVIGDSVLLGASKELAALGVVTDAVSGRRAERLLGTFRSLPDDGKPVIVHLGTNGHFTHEVCEEFHEVLDDTRPIIFVTVHAPHEGAPRSNREIRRCARTTSDSALVRWHRLANRTDGALYADGIHLTPTGVNVIVSAITRALSRVDRPTEPRFITSAG